MHMNKTKIEWCDSTWNPVTGCLHECKYCYARRIAERFKGCDDWSTYGEYHQATWHRLNPDSDLKDAIFEIYPKCPPINIRFDKKTQKQINTPAPYPWGFQPTFHGEKLYEPIHWTKPRNIFVCSMADLFGVWVPDSWIERVFDVCQKAPQHRYFFLTKNPQRYGELARAGKLPQMDNMWYGSTLDSMKAKRYPGRLLDNTFVSIEPLTEYMDVGLGSFGGDRWVIIGAETGKRKCKVTPQKEWIDKICEAADITHMAVFMKDSLISIVGEENMRREFPWNITNDRISTSRNGG
jgi:protein gp37